ALSELAQRAPGLALVAIAAPRAAGAPPPGLRQVVDADGRFAELYGARPGSFWLVRPDGHVCARWRALDADAAAAALARAGAQA
ncbi:MAG: FAD-dependent oxidoreductase, partial [Gammaproteobacteria bacterium]